MAEIAVRITAVIGLAQELVQRLPIVCMPTRGEVFGRSSGESNMVENKFCRGTVFCQSKAGNRVDTWFPASNPPRLDDELIFDQLNLTADDVVPKKRESPSWFAANPRWVRADIQAFHRSAERLYLLE